MRKHTLSDVFLALTIGGCMAVLSPQPGSEGVEAGSGHTGTGSALTAAPAQAATCPEPGKHVDLPHPATIAGQTASTLEMPFFSFGGAHLE